MDEFDIALVPRTAWALRKNLTPGGFDLPGRERLVCLREKINDAILRFVDEGDALESVDISVTEYEAWIIDQVIEFDGIGGPGTDLLIQVFRGLWGLRYGLPTTLARVSDVSYNELTKLAPDGDNLAEGLPPNSLTSQDDLSEPAF